ncbi:MAG: hypothetical protein PVF51_11465 [Nitrospirota bacterium]|jgi:hypothetical protein
MSYPAGAEYEDYRALCAQDVCVRLLAWEPEEGDYCFPAGHPDGGPLRVVADDATSTAEMRFYPRLDQLKTRCQRRLNTSWRLAQERFEQWMVEQAFFETEEEAWLRFLCHLYEAEVPPPRHM